MTSWVGTIGTVGAAFVGSKVSAIVIAALAELPSPHSSP